MSENLGADLARITRKAMVPALYDSITRKPLFEIKDGRFRIRRHTVRERLVMRYRRARVYVRNVWWALRGKTPDEETYSDWWL